MNEKSAIKNPLKQGNYHFKRGEFKAALSCYLMAAERMPELKEIIEKNIFITKEAESLEKQSRKFAIVVHCFYLDIWTEIRELLLKTRINFDLFITTPSDSNFPNEAILDYFPNARIIKSPNIGMDIVPFLSLIPTLIKEKYYAVCKLQTKKGDGELAVLWRRLMLDSLIGSPQNVDTAINAFQKNDDLALIGAGAIYQSAHKLMYENKNNIRNLLKDCYKREEVPKNDWGFFAGTMFWIKTELLSNLAEHIKSIHSTITPGYQKDGKLEHALERVFGLIPRLHNHKTALLQFENINSKNCNLLFINGTQGIGLAHLGDVMYQISRLSKDYNTIKNSKLFNKEFYETQLPELKNSNIDYIIHYLTQGYFYHAVPFDGFSFPNEILFLLKSKGGTRNPFVFYLENDGDLNKIKKSLGISNIKKAHIFDESVLLENNLFDFEFYLKQIANCGIKIKEQNKSDILKHYFQEGSYLELYPNKWFIPREYRTLNKDVTEAGFEPFFHYIKYGAIENRRYRENILREKNESPFFRYMVLNETIINWRKLLNKKREKKSVSIIIPVYNQATLTEQCLNSLISSKSKISPEIICVDNGSDTETKLVLENFSKAHKNIKVITNEENLNFSLGCNIGFREASGDIIIFLNNDTVVTDFWLDTLIQPLHEKEIVAVQPKLLYPDKTIQNSGIVFNKNQTLGYPIYAGLPSEVTAKDSRPYQAITGACLAVKAFDFASIKGFDPLFINGQEDIDLCLRLTQVSKKTCWYQSNAIVFHHESKTAGRGTYIKLNRKNFVERWRNKIKADDILFYNQDGFSIKGWHLDSEEMQSNGLAINRPILEKRTQLIRIKISCPNLKESAEWGDYHFACSMKRAFERKGIVCHVDCMDAWYTPESSLATTIIVLRGLKAYKPDPKQLNFMWNISHPDKISLDEYQLYDHIFIASKKHTDTIRKKVNRPVTCLLQCTDHELFNLNVKKETSYPVLFVGNSRDVFRPIIKAAISENLPLAVFGTRWNQFIPEHYIKGQNIDNKKLAGFYAAAGVVLNDHWESMAKHGFISNRLFDAVASGAYVISDYVEGIEEIFSTTVYIKSDSETINSLIIKDLNKNLQLNESIRLNHNFSRRIKEILKTIAGARKSHA